MKLSLNNPFVVKFPVFSYNSDDNKKEQLPMKNDASP